MSEHFNDHREIEDILDHSKLLFEIREGARALIQPDSSEANQHSELLTGRWNNSAAGANVKCSVPEALADPSVFTQSILEVASPSSRFRKSARRVFEIPAVYYNTARLVILNPNGSSEGSLKAMLELSFTDDDEPRHTVAVFNLLDYSKTAEFIRQSGLLKPPSKPQRVGRYLVDTLIELGKYDNYPYELRS